MTDQFPVRADFLELSITALSKRVEQIFEMNCPFVLGDYDRRAEDKVDGKIEYPYANLRMPRISRRQDGALNRTATRKFGFKTMLEQSGHYWFKFHGVQTTCELELRIYFGDQQDLFKAIKAFFMDETQFNFTIEANEGAFAIQHNVGTDPDFGVPPLDQGEYGLELPYSTTLRLNTWVGDIHRIPNIQTIRGRVYPMTQEAVADFTGDAQALEGQQFFEETNLKVNPLLQVT